MDILEHYRDILQTILQKYAALPYRYGEVNSYVLVSQDRNHFLLIDEGWQDGLRVYAVVVHAEFRNQKIWIQRDGIEEGITSDLLEAGITPEQIVLAFHPPELRPLTDFAIS